MYGLEVYLQSSLVSEHPLTLRAGKLESLMSGLDVCRQIVQPGKLVTTMAAGELGISTFVLCFVVPVQMVLCFTLNSTLGTQIGHTLVLGLHVNLQCMLLAGFKLTERARILQTSVLSSAVSQQTSLTVECDSALRARIVPISGVLPPGFCFSCCCSRTFWVILLFHFHLPGICVFLN